MTLMPHYFSTNGSSKKKPNKKQIKAQEEHQEWLRSRGLSNISGRKSMVKIPDYRTESNAPLSNKIENGVAAKPGDKQYTGKRKLIGIATMHKSNMVPVFSEEDAQAISKMRR